MSRDKRLKDTAHLDQSGGFLETRFALKVRDCVKCRLRGSPRSDHASEDIHEQSDINEASFEADVGDIAHSDLIGTTDLKGL